MYIVLEKKKKLIEGIRICCRAFIMDARESSRLELSNTSGMLLGPSSYGISIPNTSMVAPNSGMMQGMRLSFNSMPDTALKAIDSSSSLYHAEGISGMGQSGVVNMGEPMKKKRGRPRKYGPDGSMTLALTPLSSPSGYSNSPKADPLIKRRGRPPGSGKKQQLDALGSSGIGFTPHIITVKAGEDVASKIMAFSQQGLRTVCILSATGAICNVTLRQPATSGGTVTYEGRFEIISLSGSFLLSEDGDTRSRTGGLSVALAGSDGRVLGGGVAGMLMAATPVQVVVGTFIADGKRPKPQPSKHEPPSATQTAGFGQATSPPSQGTSSQSSDDPGSPVNQNGGNCNDSSQHIQSAHALISWSPFGNHSRHDSDMKMMPN